MYPAALHDLGHFVLDLAAAERASASCTAELNGGERSRRVVTTKGCAVSYTNSMSEPAAARLHDGDGNRREEKKRNLTDLHVLQRVLLRNTS